MICYNTEPKFSSISGTNFQLSITIVFGKRYHNCWGYDCIVAKDEREKEMSMMVAQWLNDDGTIDNMVNTLNNMNTNEVMINNRANVYFFMDFITKETNLTISFQKDRVPEYDRWIRGFVEE